MKTPRALSVTSATVYTCELETCPRCGGPLIEWGYQSSFKTVLTMTAVLAIAHRPKRCAASACAGHAHVWKAAPWQQLAPHYCTFGYDVIAQIGWERQFHTQQFADIHALLRGQLPISESQVRYLYHQKYLPLLACVERQHVDRLTAVAQQGGLILGLDGLAPEGGEPQLWVVRELQTGLTVRSGWLSQQDHSAFGNFLQPIADWGLPVAAVLSDKQRGLAPAVATVFPTAKHGFCQVHYLQNAVEPVAAATEQLKVTLRQDIRARVGVLIRQEQVAAAPGVLTVTGLRPSPVSPPPPPEPEAPTTAEGQTPPPTSEPIAPPAAGTQPPPTPEPTAGARAAIVQDLLRRVRYLLTLKARPPFGLAGLEMFERLTEVGACLEQLLQHHTDAQLSQLRAGLQQALATAQPEYAVLRQAADWLQRIADLLDPRGQPVRTGAEVQQCLWAYLDQVRETSANTPQLAEFAAAIRKVTLSYAPGLFYAYDLPGLPRTNNGRESEFRNLNRRLLRTTGQKGLTKRLIQREGAWELIPPPNTLKDTIAAFARISTHDLWEEQQRVRVHRSRFRLHTRSAKQSQAQLAQLVQRWAALPLPDGP